MCNEEDCGNQTFTDLIELQKHWDEQCATIMLECQRCETSVQRCDIKNHDCFESLMRTKKTLEQQNSELNARLIADDEYYE